MLLRSLTLTSLLFLSSFATAEPLRLFEQVSTAALWPGLSENSNHSPSFHVLQNDPELAAYFTSPGVSDLCVPATMADALLYQVSQRPARLTMNVPGVNTNGSANGADTIKYLINYCGFDPHTAQNPNGGISWSDAAPCLLKFYREQGYANAKVKYFRLGQGANPGIDYQDRYPTLQDIKDGLKAGGEVIAAISFQKFSAAQNRWVQGSSHAINIFGYGANPGDDTHLTLYLQNSNRLYNMNFTAPVFDVALLTDTGTLAPVPEKSSGIELSTLQGRLLNFPDQRTFLSAIIVIQPE